MSGSEKNADESDGGPVSMIDANALADLIGGTIASTDSPEVKRGTLLHGLSDLLGADGWAVLSSHLEDDESGMPRIPVDYRTELVSLLPGRKLLPDLSTHPPGTILWSRRSLRRGEAGYICLVRKEGGAPFSLREKRLFRIFVEEVPWLYEPVIELPPVHPVSEMPPRRRLIFDLLGQGLDRKAIAGRLAISVHTVSDHQKTLYRELGINSQITLMQHYRSSIRVSHENADIPE